jgi:protein-disulfide isomerase
MGTPINNSTLYDVALGSSLNISSFNACMANSVASLNDQAQLAKLYRVVTTPELIVNCKYATIPQTLSMAINYSLSQTKG